jgi:hypothetical protein
MFEFCVHFMQLLFQIFKHTQMQIIIWHIVGYFVENYVTNINFLDNFACDRLKR